MAVVKSLDNGDGLSSYSDVEHNVCVIEPEDVEPGPDGFCVVGAQGTTEFGPFVSLGLLEPHGEGHRLTLARRYIADKDPRVKMTADAVARRVAAATSVDGAHRKAPWMALPWKVTAEWPGPV